MLEFYIVSSLVAICLFFIYKNESSKREQLKAEISKLNRKLKNSTSNESYHRKKSEERLKKINANKRGRKIKK